MLGGGAEGGRRNNCKTPSKFRDSIAHKQVHEIQKVVELQCTHVQKRIPFSISNKMKRYTIFFSASVGELC